VCYLSNGANHYVFVNRGMVELGHVVISSADSKDIQTDPLNIQDCHAISQIIKGCNGIGIIYYNCGIESGCSQKHKHFQYASLIEIPFFGIMKDQKYLPFQYYTGKIKDDSPDEILKVYEMLMKQMNYDGSYNLIIYDEVMIIVPRKQANHSLGVSLNSLGICGHLFLQEKSDEIIERMVFQILQDIHIPCN
jgi:ATP adenylyltransferase